jgi:hypothetical protein
MKRSVTAYLSTIGVRRDFVSRLTRGQISLELYDLSDPRRLATANAETFPVPPMATDPRPGCRSFSRPTPLDDFR